MTDRSFLDGVLAEIQSESLTDAEYATVPTDLPSEYTRPVYESLKAVVQERDGVSGQLKRLNALFTAKGVDLSGVSPRDPNSSIFVGAAL